MEHLIVLIIQMKIIVTATYMHAQNVCNTFIIFTWLLWNSLSKLQFWENLQWRSFFFKYLCSFTRHALNLHVDPTQQEKIAESYR